MDARSSNHHSVAPCVATRLPHAARIRLCALLRKRKRIRPETCAQETIVAEKFSS